jgi:hypothetical protein
MAGTPEGLQGRGEDADPTAWAWSVSELAS